MNPQETEDPFRFPWTLSFPGASLARATVSTSPDPRSSKASQESPDNYLV